MDKIFLGRIWGKFPIFWAAKNHFEIKANGFGGKNGVLRPQKFYCFYAAITKKIIMQAGFRSRA